MFLSCIRSELCRYKYLKKRRLPAILDLLGLPIDVTFGFRVGFSGAVDLMVQHSFSNNSKWRLAAIFEYTKQAITL